MSKLGAGQWYTVVLQAIRVGGMAGGSHLMAMVDSAKFFTNGTISF